MIMLTLAMVIADFYLGFSQFVNIGIYILQRGVSRSPEIAAAGFLRDFFQQRFINLHRKILIESSSVFIFYGIRRRAVFSYTNGIFWQSEWRYKGRYSPYC